MKSSYQLFAKGLIAVVALAGFTACAPSAPQLKKVMEENPDILYGVIQKDPKKFLDVVNEAAQKARQAEEGKMAEEETKKREEEFANPKKPAYPDDRAYAGDKNAPVTIVEYSDFQCPFCRRGHSTMKQVLEAYPGKVRVLFKNFPIERIHPLARPASEMYEAIALQNTDKAYKFLDAIFEGQDEMNAKGEKFFDEIAKKVGADVAKAKKDAKGDVVQKRLEADRIEAEQYGFSGTPGYLINGVSLRGAYPFDDFKQIIDRHLAGK